MKIYKNININALLFWGIFNFYNLLNYLKLSKLLYFQILTFTLFFYLSLSMIMEFNIICHNGDDFIFYHPFLILSSLNKLWFLY